MNRCCSAKDDDRQSDRNRCYTDRQYRLSLRPGRFDVHRFPTDYYYIERYCSCNNKNVVDWIKHSGSFRLHEPMRFDRESLERFEVLPEMKDYISDNMKTNNRSNMYNLKSGRSTNHSKDVALDAYEGSNPRKRSHQSFQNFRHDGEYGPEDLERHYAHPGFLHYEGDVLWYEPNDKPQHYEIRYTDSYINDRHKRALSTRWHSSKNNWIEYCEAASTSEDVRSRVPSDANRRGRYSKEDSQQQRKDTSTGKHKNAKSVTCENLQEKPTSEQAPVIFGNKTRKTSGKASDQQHNYEIRQNTYDDSYRKVLPSEGQNEKKGRDTENYSSSHTLEHEERVEVLSIDSSEHLKIKRSSLQESQTKKAHAVSEVHVFIDDKNTRGPPQENLSNCEDQTVTTVEKVAEEFFPSKDSRKSSTSVVYDKNYRGSQSSDDAHHEDIISNYEDLMSQDRNCEKEDLVAKEEIRASISQVFQASRESLTDSLASEEVAAIAELGISNEHLEHVISETFESITDHIALDRRLSDPGSIKPKTLEEKVFSGILTGSKPELYELNRSDYRVDGEECLARKPSEFKLSAQVLPKNESSDTDPEKCAPSQAKQFAAELRENGALDVPTGSPVLDNNDRKHSRSNSVKSFSEDLDPSRSVPSRTSLCVTPGEQVVLTSSSVAVLSEVDEERYQPTTPESLEEDSIKLENSHPSELADTIKEIQCKGVSESLCSPIGASKVISNLLRNRLPPPIPPFSKVLSTIPNRFYAVTGEEELYKTFRRELVLRVIYDFMRRRSNEQIVTFLSKKLTGKY